MGIVTDLIDEGSLADDVKKAKSDAIAILDRIDRKLSNSFTGDKKSEHDKAVKELRNLFQKSMDAISSDKIFSQTKKLG